MLTLDCLACWASGARKWTSIRPCTLVIIGSGALLGLVRGLKVEDKIVLGNILWAQEVVLILCCFYVGVDARTEISETPIHETSTVGEDGDQ